MKKIWDCLIMVIVMMFLTVGVISVAGAFLPGSFLAGIAVMIMAVILAVWSCANVSSPKQGYPIALVFALLNGLSIAFLLGEQAGHENIVNIWLSFATGTGVFLIVGLLATTFRVKDLAGMGFCLVIITLMGLAAAVSLSITGQWNEGLLFTWSVFAVLLFCTWVVFDIQVALQTDEPVWKIGMMLYLDAINIAVNFLGVFSDD